MDPSPADQSDGNAWLRPGVWPPSGPARFASAVAAVVPGGRNTLGPNALCLLGMADDRGVVLNKGRQGAAQGPAAFRAALAGYGVLHPADQAEALKPFGDVGDVLAGATLTETHDRVTAVARSLLGAGLFPVGIGGGHDLTFAFSRATCQSAGIKRVVYLDPHLDVRAEEGSGMPFRALVERCGVTDLLCIGAEPAVNTRAHFEWFTAKGGRTCSVQEAIGLGSALFAHPCHFSFDLDALDASAAPGVSAMNPAGARVKDAAAICFHAGMSPMVRSFDIMELCPPHDSDGRTARAAAYCFMAFARGFSRRTGGQAC